MSREFVSQLDVKESRALSRMLSNLLDQGKNVHDVMHTFARSLKNFVQSREYLEQRRLNQLLNDTQSTALKLKDKIKSTDELNYTLVLTSSYLKSLSQWELFDPEQQAVPDTMRNGDAPDIGMDSVADLVAQSEIDFRTLKENISSILETRTQATIADVLEQYPASQGLGSVVGLISLGSRYGCKTENYENVSWTGNDQQLRSAQIPKIYFLPEKSNETA
jgi:vacuolar-type H+-ATPase subunit I/STV1